MNREQIDQLALDLMAKQKAHRVAEHSKLYEPATTTATSLGYACERRIVYGRCFPADAAPFGDELLSIFSEGDLHQKDVRRELSAIGFEVVESEVRFKDERLDIAGSIDGKISVDDDRNTHTQRRIPVEIKSTTGAPPATEADLRTSETALLRRYYAQFQTYLYLTSEPFGLFLFKDKITGLWTVVSIALDYAYVETLLKRAERVRDAVKLVKLGATKDEQLALVPDRVQDRGECVGCPFADTLCHPADAPVDPMLIAMEPELLAQLKERESTEQASGTFKKIDEKIKSRLKLTKFDSLVVGGPDGFVVTKKVYSNDSVRISIKRLAA